MTVRPYCRCGPTRLRFTPVTLESPSAVIGDYDTMASKYHEPVVQAYGKGIRCV